MRRNCRNSSPQRRVKRSQRLNCNGVLALYRKKVIEQKEIKKEKLLCVNCNFKSDHSSALLELSANKKRKKNKF